MPRHETAQRRMTPSMEQLAYLACASRHSHIWIRGRGLPLLESQLVVSRRSKTHRPEEDPVPCFYFDIREGTKLTVDDEGLEFVSLDAAESGAISAAADIWRNLLRGSDPRAVTVEVRNEHGQWVLTVSVAMESHRVEPQPVPPCACKNTPHNFA